MRYKSFRIRNFKGIKDTIVHLQGIAGASVFTFVGLNESGKTTILEAIHSFSPEDATSKLVGDAGAGVPYAQRVPRHLISSFTGHVSVSATLSIDPDELNKILDSVERDHDGLTINRDDLPKEIVLERQQKFNRGDFEKNYFSLRTSFRVRRKAERRLRAPASEESTWIRDALWSSTPDIAYFPTFVFEFPERIYLTNRGNNIDRFYRSVFQDILDFNGKGSTIEEDIVRRVRDKQFTVPWVTFIESWKRHSNGEKIQHVMDQASATVTEVVFGRWNKIFKEDARDKEIIITFDTAEGEIRDGNGNVAKTNSHDIWIQFKVKDGTRRFAVNDRSLGFRWFFSFMLFTQFRVARSSSRPLLFLFDEPASNLHAAAQQRLLECFPEIAKGKHALAYSTHSHYMIEPKWLEQTFIVTNRADAPMQSIIDAASLDDQSLDIKAESYRSFVDKHPNQSSYFQPILDRLGVVPSRLDLQRSGIVLEGKSDYYILRYAAKLFGFVELPLIPGLGAGTFDALASLHVGWNLNFLFLLDSDRQGEVERERYLREYGILPGRIILLEECTPSAKCIEDVLDGEALSMIAGCLGTSSVPNKAQIRRFFQERLASDNVQGLGNNFLSSTKNILIHLSKQLQLQEMTQVDSASTLQAAILQKN